MIYLLIRSNVIPHLQVIVHMCRAPRWSYVFMSNNIGEASLKTGDGAGDVLVQLVGDRMHLFGEMLHLEAFQR